MRTLYRAVAGLFTVALSIPAYPEVSMRLSDREQNLTVCGPQSTEGQCGVARQVLCKVKGMQGCSSQNRGAPIQLDPIQWKPGAANYQQVEGVLNKTFADAQNCCAGEKGCHDRLPPGVAQHKDQIDQTVQKNNLRQAKGNQAANGAMSRTQDESVNGWTSQVKYAEGLSGACLASREICALHYEQATDQLKENCKNCGRIRENLQKKAQACRAIPTQMRDQSLAQSQEGMKQSQASRETTKAGNQQQAGGSPAGGGGDNTAARNGGRDSAAGSGAGNGMGQMAQSLGSMLPMLMSAMAQQGQQEQQQPQSQTENPYANQQVASNCTENPALAGCAPATVSWNGQQGTGEARGSEDGASGSGFNLGDNGDAMQTASLDTGEKPAGIPVTTRPVANGGGQMPGGGGGGPGASLGGGGGGGGGAAGKSNLTDILHGEGGAPGGGLGRMAESMQMQTGGSGGYSYNQGGGGAGGEYQGLRLADYLPGGNKYKGASAARNIAGLDIPARMQIQSKSVNIWTRISGIIQGRCAEGRLRDCGP